MPFFRSLAEDASIVELFARFPEVSKRMINSNSYIMRGPSPLSAGQRETIAAYVSMLNSCDYCVGSHGETARAFGVPAETLKALSESLDTAPVDDEFRPILRFVKKLTLNPSRMVAGDAEAVFEAGWDEAALFSVILVCGLFNFVNRLVDGAGLIASEEQAKESAKLLHEQGYEVILKLIGVEAGSGAN